MHPRAPSKPAKRSLQFNVPDVVQEIKEKAPADPANRLKRKAESAANAVTPDSGPSLPKVEVPQLKFDTQSLWPLGLVAAPAALFGLSKIDPGTEKIFETGWVKARPLLLRAMAA